MGKYRLQQIELFNYKLFEYKLVDFDNANLAVLDGPNGYGKTSIFEAIEYIITGTIKRAEESPEVNGTIAYNTHFLANNTLSPVIVKGVFITKENEQLEIERKLLVEEISGINNNPKNLKSVTKSKIVLNNETLCENLSVDGTQVIVEQLFGKNIIKYYDKFYYISQEDRLSFLMCTEQMRMNQIRTLFDMEKEINEFNNFSNYKKEIDKKIKSFDKKHLAESKNIEKDRKTFGEKKETTVNYTPLIVDGNKRPYWDKQNIKIIDKQKLEEIYAEVKGVFEFTKNKNTFLNSKNNSLINSFRKDENKLEMFLFMLTYEKNLQVLFDTNEGYTKLNSLILLLEESKDVDVENINFNKIKEQLDISSDISEVNLLKKDIEKCRSSQNILFTSLEKLQNSRELLTKTVKTWHDAGGSDIPETTCPYCGTDLFTKEAYDEAIISANKTLKKCTNNELEQIQNDIKRLSEIYDSDYKIPVTNYFQQNAFLKNDVISEIFQNWNTIINEFSSFVQFCDKLNIPIRDYVLDVNDEINWVEKTVDFSNNVLKQYLASISEEYGEMDSKYGFDFICTQIYEGNINNIDALTDEQLTNKLKYIEEQYYLSAYNVIEKREVELEHNTDVINKLKDFEKEIEKICNVYKGNLASYQNKIIGKIKIPLYLYTGKILQNYQGGLGVYIYSDKKDEKLDSIRFLSPNQIDHDISYTLSSGQLSGIIIALTLTLNKFYGEESFECLLIDDPVQTMDDLNIASLVEVLRNEFSDHQLIVSTHEDDFSRYVRYKYEKYGLSVAPITLKAIN